MWQRWEQFRGRGVDQRQDHWVTKNGEDECVLIVVRHISLGNAQLMASDVGSARPSTTLQRCAGKGCRVQLVEKESSTPPESEEVVLLISVEKVGALPSRWEDPGNCVPTSILQCVVMARLSKTRKPASTGKWNYSHYE